MLLSFSSHSTDKDKVIERSLGGVVEFHSRFEGLRLKDGIQHDAQSGP